MVVLLGFAFLSGLVTILAPCIWPLLPIVLSSSIAGGNTSHKRPLGITLGVMTSFALFTLTVSYLIKLFGLDPNILRIMAVVIIGFLGLAMIIPYLMIKFELLVSKLSSSLQTNRQTSSSGFGGGFVTGLSLGIVWSPCAGPILASIAALAATGQVSAALVFVTFSYVAGVGIPLFIFAYAGQQLITRSRAISPYTGRIQQVFGVVMILTALAIYTNYDKVIQVKLLDLFPQFGTALNSFESNGVVTEQLNKLKGQTRGQVTENNSLFNTDTTAPEFAGITKWLNPETPLTMSSLKGKVVLIDFWTYTCINCIRTLPHVTAWYDKYKDQGFVVVGVHTPEFAFEKETVNVQKAIKQFNIHYPVAQDNNYSTWNAYDNQYWPAEYLIDAKGNVRRTHFGEGEYEETEQAIQTLLKEAGQQVSDNLINVPDQTPTVQTSPETYVGAKRMAYLDTIKRVGEGVQSFTLNPQVSVNHFSLGGQWNITSEYAISQSNSTLVYHFKAGKVYLVMKPTSDPGKVSILLDGKPIDPSVSGEDVKNGEVIVDSDRLYTLVNIKDKVEEHSLQLNFQTLGTQAYAFTFGS